jgi:hypothetical protein
VACGLGASELTLPGFSTGIFATSLSVTRGDVTFDRRAIVIAGTPAAITTQGALTTADLLDPDFGSSYRIDYYDVTGLAGTRAFAIEADSGAFGTFLVLYDLDQRDFVTGGGILDFGVTLPNGVPRIIVIPEAGRRYLIGISSFETDALGSYTVSILNDGTLTPH